MGDGGKPVAEKKLKSLTQALDVPALPASSLRFAEWVARYTLTPLGMVVRMMMGSHAVFEPVRPRFGVRLTEGAADPPRLTPAQLIGIPLTELQCPLADRLVRHENAATGHQFLDVAKTQRKSEVQPYDVADDVVWEAKAEIKLGGCHASSLQKLPRSAKLTVPTFANATEPE